MLGGMWLLNLLLLLYLAIFDDYELQIRLWRLVKITELLPEYITMFKPTQP
jgi:hypothetical protein